MQPQPLIRKNSNAELIQAAKEAFGLVEFSVDGAILSVNANFLSMSGYSAEELIGKKHSHLCPDCRLFIGQDGYWDQLKSSRSFSGQFCLQRRDGSDFWVEAAYYMVLSESGKPEKVVHFCLDVTSRVESGLARHSLLEAIERSLAIAEYSPAKAVLHVNDNFIITLGYTEQQLIGKTITDITPASKAAAKRLREIWDMARSGHSHAHMMEWKTASGATAWLETVFTPILNSMGRVERIVQLSYDITWLVAEGNKEKEHLRILSLVALETGHAVAITDAGARALFLNDSFKKLFGYTEKDFAQKSPARIFGPEEQRVLAKSLEAAASGIPYRSEEIAYAKNGQRLWVSLLVNPVFNAQGEREYLVCAVTDITDSKLHELLQHKALEAMARDMPIESVLRGICQEVERILSDVRVAVVGLDEQGHINTFVSLSLPLHSLDFKDMHSGPEESPVSVAVKRGGTVIVRNLAAAPYSERARRTYANLGLRACFATPVFSAGGRPLGALLFYYPDPREPDSFQWKIAEAMASICSVAMEKKESKATVRRLAFYEAVTGLPNRDFFKANAEQFLANIVTDPAEKPFALLVLNIDRFKRVTRPFGYSGGNEILKIVAQRLSELVLPGNLLGHMAPDEFIMILKNCGESEAWEAALRIQETIARPFSLNGIELALSACLGISLYPRDGASVETLLGQASAALFQAKKRGAGQLRLFAEDVHCAAFDTISFEYCLRDAVEHGKLQLHYQPQVWMESGGLHGVEALCRWTDETLGSVPPDQFIPVAEECGLIQHVSDWVLRETCRQLGEWRRRGVPVPTASINLSPPNFRDVSLPEKILRTLSEHNLGPGDLILELTEGVLLDDSPNNMDTVHKAHEAGLRLALDDFGTGYSSLSYLKKLPISKIKLDQSFVRDLHKNELSKRLSQAVINIGESLNLTVIAEGVESEEQYRLLKSQRYHVAQGYLFSKPLPPVSLEQWIVSREAFGGPEDSPPLPVLQPALHIAPQAGPCAESAIPPPTCPPARTLPAPMK